MRLLPLLCLLIGFTACDNAATPPPADELTAASADTFRLVRYAMADSVLYDANLPDGPAGYYDVQALTITDGSPDFQRLVHDRLLAEFVGPEASVGQGGYADAYRRELDDLMANYGKEDLGVSVTDAPSAYREAVSMQTTVLMNRAGYLTLGVLHYGYSGGAHGNYATQLITFADQPPRVLSLADFLTTPLDSAALTALLKAEIDPERLYDPEEDIEVTDNVGLVEGGLLFNYPPYAIGPYAAGEIEVTLSFADLRAAGLTERRHPVTDE